MMEARNMRILRAIPLLIVVCFVSLPAYAQYSGGSGTAEDPYQIATAEDLMLLGESPGDYDKHFILTADIDLNPNLPGRKVFDRAVIAAPDVNDAEGWFQWSPFTGTFDGDNHTFSHLTITGGGFLGLFGHLDSGATISNLALEAVNVNGTGECVGGLVGCNLGSITSSYSTGSVSGDENVGGLVGGNGVCLASCEVRGRTTSWAIVDAAGSITNSYSTGTVTGSRWVGGLVGWNASSIEGMVSITNSYSTGSVSGDENVGGLVGSNEGSITTSYSTGSVSGPGDHVGGLVGKNGGSITTSFWDIETSGQATSAGGTGKTTAEMQTASTFLEAGWDFVDETANGTDDIWWIDEGKDYPRLWWESHEEVPEVPFPWEGEGTEDSPFLIYTAEELNMIGSLPLSWNRHFKLMADIDISGKTYSEPVIPSFSGTFDGNKLTISNLTIIGNDVLGLFGRLESPAEVMNLGIGDVNVVGSRFVGGLAGKNYGIAANCYSTGMVTGNEDIGGLVGRNGGSIATSYSTGTVSGDEVVGGLVGENQGSITACYSTGTVTGQERVGGLGGRNRGDIATSYSTGMVNGSKWVGGLVGENDSQGSITTSYSSGSVNGIGDYIGGLVGRNDGSIVANYSTGAVSGGNSVGGLVGYNRGIVIASSYSSGTVTGWSWVGGLVGRNDGGSITACYSTASVNGNHEVGGLVGLNNGSITSCYSTGTVSGSSDIGGIVGSGGGLVLQSVWDMETSGLTVSNGSVGLTTSEMMDPYMLGLNGFANDPNWVLDAGRDYPRLAWEGTAGQIIPEPVIDWLSGQGTEQEPYRIDSADQLISLRRASGLWDKHFILSADIDLDPNLQGGQVFSQAVIQVFSGVFDGNDHTISHLTISGDSYLGLFGRLGPGAIISNLALESVNVNGTGDSVGGLVGSNGGSMATSYSTGTVSGRGNNVGGLVGINSGSLTTSYSTGTVSGGSYSGTGDNVGGLVGINSGSLTTSYSTSAVIGVGRVGGLIGYNRGSITESYSTGTVIGGSRVGGLVGENDGSIATSYSTGTVSGVNHVGGLAGWESPWRVTDCFWDIHTSGQATSAGGTGLTTAEMQTASTFLEAGWDFVDETANGTDDIWWIDEGQGYPRLWWELNP